LLIIAIALPLESFSLVDNPFASSPIAVSFNSYSLLIASSTFAPHVHLPPTAPHVQVFLSSPTQAHSLPELSKAVRLVISLIAAPMFSLPARQRLEFSTTSGSQGSKLWRMALRTAVMSGFRPACTSRDNRSAATPATMGAATLVPLRSAIPPPDTAP